MLMKIYSSRASLGPPCRKGSCRKAKLNTLNTLMTKDLSSQPSTIVKIGFFFFFLNSPLYLGFTWCPDSPVCIPAASSPLPQRVPCSPCLALSFKALIPVFVIYLFARLFD